MNTTSRTRTRRGGAGNNNGGNGHRKKLLRVWMPCPVGGEPLPFWISHEYLDFDGAGVLEFIGLPPLALHEPKGLTNARSAIELFWRRRYGGTDCRTLERDDCVTRLLAELCVAGRRDKSVGHVYRQAFLGPFARRNVKLDDEEVDRLRTLVARRDPSLLRGELDDLFLGRDQLPDGFEECMEYQGQMEDWVGRGLRLWKTNVDGGISMWLANVTGAMAKMRRRGDAKQGGGRGAWARRFLNCAAYEARAALLACFAEALDVLTDWLAVRMPLDANSVRMMKLLHALHRPSDPTSLARGDGPGVLFGQVLSMHPLGLWMLARPAHRAALGAWVAHPDHDRLLGTPAALACPAYQDAVVAILSAARELRIAGDMDDKAAADTREQALRRPHGRGPSPNGADYRLASAAAADPGVGIVGFLDELTWRAVVRCPECGKRPDAGSDDLAIAPGKLTVGYRCPSCTHVFRRTFDAKEIRLACPQIGRRHAAAAAA